MSLLPPNTSLVERAIEAATARLSDVPVPLRQLVDPDTCPVRLLPYLAWALSIDTWDSDWPEAVMRNRVRQAIDIQRRKGTASSVRDVVASFGGSLALREWWQMVPRGDPIIEKSAQALMVLSIDVTLADITAGLITFGNADFLLPAATTDRQGLVELATPAEAKLGTDQVRAVTPATAKTAVFDWLGYVPLQQGGGIGQGVNRIQIGWDGFRLSAPSGRS